MAAITSAVVVAGATAYGAKKQSDAAKDAARMQSEGVKNAQDAQFAASQRALPELRSGFSEAADFLQSGLGQSRDQVSQGYGQAIQTLSPLAQLSQRYTDEQYNLLGLGGDAAYQQALSRVSDPLQAEQERALRRNNAQFGGVGGNVLSALAEQTRSRTEANIGNRLQQLGAASAPSLDALQQISGMQLNRGLNMADIVGQYQGLLAQNAANRGQSIANTEIGQGSQMAQLAQNLGNANAGYAAYRAGNPSALSQGLAAGLNAYTGAGGNFNFQWGGNPNTTGTAGSRAGDYSGSAMQNWIASQGG